VSMQQRVQQTVLHLIHENGRLEPRAVALRCPGSDQQDLAAAAEILQLEGFIETSLPDRGLSVAHWATAKGNMQLTATGLRRLASTIESHT
jgi:hypothetical protein